MNLKIASFNLENLFTRPTAMEVGEPAAGQQAIDDHAILNRIVAQDVYVERDKLILLELDERYQFSALNPPANTLVFLQKVRGQLYSRSGGALHVAANGRADWTGWFELRRTSVSWSATFNTGRVIAEVDPDILVCIEVEDRITLKRFNDQVLDAGFAIGYPHVMLIDGNDERGIDVGILSRHPINAVRSHIDDRTPDGQRLFSRDCPEYVVDLPGDRRLLVLPNHFKSKRGGNDAVSEARRRRQAERTQEIAAQGLAITPYVLIAGDLNDTPDSPALASLWQGGFIDVQHHANYPKDRPGTYATGTKGNKIDYLIMSPALSPLLVDTGIERRGSYHPRTWEPFDTVKGSQDEASDHHMLWGVFTFGP